MKKIIFTLCVVAATSAANAMDFYVGDKISYTYTQQIVSSAGWRLDLDAPLLPTPSYEWYDETTSESDNGIRNKVFVGLGFPIESVHGAIRAEIEYGFGSTVYLSEYQKVSTHTIQTNYYYDYYATDKIIPFVGIGIGLARNKTEYDYSSLGSFGHNRTYGTNSFIYNLQVGIAYKLLKNWTLDIGYRYSNLADSKNDYDGETTPNENHIHSVLSSHEVLLGVRYSF